MTKKEFLHNLRRNLEEYNILDKIIEEIVEDHESMIHDGVEKGLSEEEVINKLGKPSRIARALRDEAKQKNQSGKIISLMPIITAIIFVFIGIVFSKWHPTWLIFTLIPVTAILVETRGNTRIISLMPFITGVTYLILGFEYSLWHIAWILFLLIPVTAIILAPSKQKLIVVLTSLSPFIALVAFMAIGYYKELWNPGWVVFFIVPIIGLLNDKSSFKKLISITSIILSVGVYLILDYNNGFNWINTTVFLIPIIIGIIFGDIKVRLDLDNEDVPYRFLQIMLASIILFLVLGILNYWHPGWLVLLAIPVSAILLHNDNKNANIIAISPFVALTIFMLLGSFWSLWSIAWLAFLLIPITAIVVETNN